ncbi:MAG: matrixin family metalloprotease [Candidatus Moraniibacteriota bacterium]
MRKIFDFILILAVAVFSIAYSINTPFREGVIAEVQMIRLRTLAQNIQAIPQEVKHSTVGGCPAPITYRVSDIDPRFGVTREQVMVQLQEATQVWNIAAGGGLLVYRDDGVMPVSLVYDERQALAVEIEKESGTLQTQEERLKYINQKYTTQKKVVDAKKSAYADGQDQYDKALSDLEDNVRKYEADPANYDKQAYADLLKKQKKVRQMYADLESQRQDINTAVAALNALVSNSNTIKNSFNSTVSTYNQSVDAKQQTQEDFAGVYFSDRHIEIYQFLNTDELRSVLIHELGHALGFEHSTDPRSIMYYEAQPGQVLTDVDKQKALDLCK